MTSASIYKFLLFMVCRSFTAFLFVIIAVVFSLKLTAQDSIQNHSYSKKYTHYVGLELRPAIILRSPAFYKDDLRTDFSKEKAISAHLKYSFSLPAGSLGSQIFSQTKQGIGLAYFDLGNRDELGTPVAAYFFQNAEIANITPYFSLNYEWNFGLSAGWKPYHWQNNARNAIIGSKLNAYINFGVYFNWQFSPKLSFIGGAEVTHFSNGNTEYPNAGFNTTGLKLGVLYTISAPELVPEKDKTKIQIPKFPRHISYDFVIFGAWRRKGVEFQGQQVPSPDKYPVIGAYFAPMYNLGYRLRTGISLDAIYDGSANVYTEDYIVGTKQPFYKPKSQKQLALGVSARAEYTMPIFTIGVGIGTHFWHNGGDFRGTYQSFALKIRTTKSSFLHIGYNLKDFKKPNYLMLGIGYRFNNKAPSLL